MQQADINKDYNKPIILNLSPQKRLKKSNSPRNGKNQGLLGNFCQKDTFQQKSDQKETIFLKLVSFRDQSLLKETVLGALRWFNFPK